ncbi:uncharacterized protein LOC113359783 [Papaver somniferum]|uniref:uncharacterized protein LOC113359783 n=1 Tax=Papaver somniferum TaxID=3469 RepID=UPI000E6F9E0B|nr:uncharacterized protein LOC113359783 [Papaver somniferum]
MDYYAYRISPRVGEYSTILRGEIIFQEFIVGAWEATEQNRLEWMEHGQLELRAQNYKKIYKIVASNQNPAEAGQPLILPSLFTGGPRYMYEIYQDSMSITRYNHHPDIFLTVTKNPNWEEIRGSLFPNQQPHERPDLVARVFDLKRKALMNEIQENRVFGTTVAHVYTIEFQKRGFPHVYALIFLDKDDKIRTPEQVDIINSTENLIEFSRVSECVRNDPYWLSVSCPQPVLFYHLLS